MYESRGTFGKPKGTWYMWVIRIAAFCIAPILWYVSFTFSVKGFAFFLPEWVWVGQIFGIVFTILELMFNRGVSKHPTLFYAGIFAYIYSVGTNILGLFTASDLSTVHGAMLVLSAVMLIILAFALDILPESMLIWSFYPDEPIVTGDFVSSLMSGARTINGRNGGHRTDVPRTNVLNKHFGPQTDTFLGDIDERAGTHGGRAGGQQFGRASGQVGGQAKNKVRSYVFRNNRPGVNLSSREIAGKLGLGKSAVAEILKEMREKGEIK